jgi:thiol-disulfide isomerase/thioredoxin
MNGKKLLKELLAGAVIIFILSNIISWIRQPKLDSTHLPERTVALLDGSTYRLKPGKPVMIHFWATWCRVCKLEAPNIQHLSQKYEVLTVAVDSGSVEDIQDYMEKHQLLFKVLNDYDSSWAKRFNVTVFPTTFIYDSSGELRFSEVGYTTTAGLLARMKLVE